VRLAATAPLGLVLCPATASAEPPTTHRLEVAAALGYAIPFASAEAGSRLSDTTIGLVPIEIDAAYLVTESIAVGGWARYGVGIPTLCKTASDCTGSLGSDFEMAARVRFLLPRLWRVAPLADLGLGYEWFSSRLTDGGVTSTRSYHGPLLLSAGVAAPYHLSERWTLGPAVDAALGAFTSAALETPAGTVSGTITGRTLHLWLSFEARLAASF